MLNIHNQERAAVGVPPLTWSNSLAADSQSWANHLTTLGLVCDDQRCDATPHGAKNENIASGVADLNSPAELAQLWADEKSKYNAGQRSGAGIGHYTAMVWQNTREVGCGFSSGGGWVRCAQAIDDKWQGDALPAEQAGLMKSHIT